MQFTLAELGALARFYATAEEQSVARKAFAMPRVEPPVQLLQLRCARATRSRARR
jgi:hypothetical protein